jgi:hypothetical protein
MNMIVLQDLVKGRVEHKLIGKLMDPVDIFDYIEIRIKRNNTINLVHFHDF